MGFSGWEDSSVLEAASWRLASELVRRHPEDCELIRGHPGGGLSDCLWLFKRNAPGDVRLNRNGTIQVLERFDGRGSQWEPTEWDTYFRADPMVFLRRLEDAAGLPTPAAVPPATPRTLTLRVLAAIAATGIKSVDPIEITPGMVDTGGYGGGPSDFFSSFAIPPALLAPLPDDLCDTPQYRFWFVLRRGEPILAFEQRAGTAWTRASVGATDLMGLYSHYKRDPTLTALELLRHAVA